MIKKATLSCLAKHLNPSSQIVMRADFNVPIKDGKISDLNRITMTIPTIKELAKHNPKSIVLLSHLGRPNGEKNPKFSLKPIVGPLETLLNRKVTFLDQCVGQSVTNKINSSNGEIFLCENVRFYPEEEGSTKKEGKKVKCAPQAIQKFRAGLSALGNVYVNDAFGSAHRAHSSVVGIKSKYRVAGLLMERELQFLGHFLQKPKKPVLVILGGSKVTDKIELIMNMLNIADEIIIGGGMSNAFLQHIHGYKLGCMKIEYPADKSTIQKILDTANQKGVKIHLPVDAVCGTQFSIKSEAKTFMNADIPDGWEPFDKGPESTKLFDAAVCRANSIFWNGPIGVFEFPQFKKGSVDLLDSVVKRTKAGATSIIGGGDTASLVASCHLESGVTYISTGGGATLQFMQGIKLPGVTSLSQRSQL